MSSYRIEDEAAWMCLERVRREPNCCCWMDDAEIGKYRRGIESAVQTTGTVFPDFKFDGGFIEHFQVTSTKESKRKGSEYKKEMSRFDAQYKAEFEEFKEKAPCGKVEIFQKYQPEVTNSHENLISSFKKNWDAHITSLKSNPEYLGQTSIFLVEYTVPMGLCMCEDLPSGRTSEFYRLCWDRALLEYIQEYKELVQYIVFVTSDAVEVIPTSKIYELLEDLPYPFHITPLSCRFSVTQSVLYKLPMDEHIVDFKNEDIME